jgi:hypothetical protein
MLPVQNTALRGLKLHAAALRPCIFQLRIECSIKLLVEVSATSLSRYMILDTVMSTYDELAATRFGGKK